MCKEPEVEKIGAADEPPDDNGHHSDQLLVDSEIGKYKAILNPDGHAIPEGPPSDWGDVQVSLDDTRLRPPCEIRRAALSFP